MRTERTEMGSATFSDCGHYRYKLDRYITVHRSPTVTFIMLNPSTACGRLNDATLRRCIGFAQRWGMGCLRVVNLFAMRTPYPKALRAACQEWKSGQHVGEPCRPMVPAPVGVENMSCVTRAVRRSTLVVCAWGPNGTLLDQCYKVAPELLRLTPLHVLRLTKGGHPHHPLRLPKTLQPQRWEGY